jgi:membrane-bound acyltransferase YfiQ involved in biofilm formation
MLGLVYVLYIIQDTFPDIVFHEYISRIQTTLVVAAIIILFIGFIGYLKKAKFDYGLNFTYGRFLFGTPICRDKHFR